ncbi:MAG: penicillin-binding protein 2 [Flavobacteriales bacterium]|nr:penicillin-binding protein 2 [Flavobacteriales bacterium]
MKPAEEKKLIFILIICGLAIIFIIRLFFLQIVDDSWKLSADNNVTRHITEYPARGLVYDRNGQLLVYNQASYDIMLIPRQMSEFDTLKLCQALDIDKINCLKRIYKVKAYSYRKPSIFLKQVSAETYASFQESLHGFPGFYAQARTTRKYAFNMASHILGNIGEVGKRLVENDKSYKAGDYTGITGIEKSYESVLRGTNGKSVMMVDVFGRVQGKFKNGEHDIKAIPGKKINLTIDKDLQLFGEALLKGKSGSVVAIDPQTGEILALVSSPFYDPNLLVGRKRAENYATLTKDESKPLFNRAIMAQYPPGSTFKLVNALIGMQEGIVDSNSYYSCNMGYDAGRLHVGCHRHTSPINLKYSIRTSCNAYYCHVFRSIIDKYSPTEKGFNNWRNHVEKFGLGHKSGIDLPHEVSGILPSKETYDSQHGVGRWKSLYVVSLAIGQGELSVSPLQMANMTAIIANKGYFYKPHIVMSDSNNISTYSKQFTDIDRKHFDLVRQAMNDVIEKSGGTGGRAKIKGIKLCGKTGTAQNPHGDDHSIFIAFAPMDNPKIAIAAYIENAGYGSTMAAPIASLMIEKYLTDSISRPRMADRIYYPDSTFRY